MNPAVIVLMALFLSSLMLSIVFFAAWRVMDHPRHALLWSMAFAIGAIQWIINGIGVVYFPGSGIFFLIMTIAPIVQIDLSLAGYRERSGLPLRWKAMIATALVAVLATAATLTILPHQGIRYAIIPVYTAVALILCIRAILRRQGEVTAAEKTVIAMLGLCAAFELVLTVIALAQGQAGDPVSIARYRALLLLGLPSLYIGSGLFSVFLLAADLADRMRRLAASDPLTGILNRRGFEEAAERAIANARRQRQPLTLAIADLDHFKSINDRFGHAAGDVALRRFVGLVEAGVRRGDLFGRMGGEEFAILLVNAPARSGHEVIERLRERIAAMTIDLDPPFAITSSFGLTEMAAGDDAIGPMLVRADRALYRAKIEGRNRVTTSEVSGTEAR